MILGTAVAAFFCFSVGIAPGWLYGLMPTELSFQPFDADQLAPQLELLGAAGVVYIGVWAIGLAPKESPRALLDLDALYRGPIAGMARWSGVLALRLFGAGEVVVRRLGQESGALLARLARACDQPYRTALMPIVQLVIISVVVLLFIVGQQL
jgi:multicomponent Na+:H+ antiporter subunit D